MGKRIKFFILLAFLFIVQINLFAQYLTNPSFEGYSSLGNPPPGWSVCDFCSTVDTEPGNLQYIPPSNGQTYIGMTGRGVYSNPDCTETCEACQASLAIPLSTDSCYIITVDLAYNPYCSWAGHNYYNPLKLEVWAGTESCSQEELLWSSPTPENSWNTYSFEVIPNFEITELFLQSNYTQASSHWGNIMVDNITIENNVGIINLGNDTILCNGESLILNAGDGFNAYLWNTGSEEQSIEISESGIYWVEGFFGSCSSADTIQVEILPSIEVNLGNDTIVCSEQINLDAGNGFDEYQWNTGETSQTIQVSEDGLYIVSVFNNNGCEAIDSIFVNFEYEQIDLGADTVLCIGQELILDAGDGYEEYIWNTGSNEQTIQVNEGGFYWVSILNEYGCYGIDTIQVIYEDETVIDLGNDTTICTGSSFVLSAGLYNLYEWQDGSQGSEIVISEAGVYWVNVLGGCNWASDTIIVDTFPQPTPDLGQDTTICTGSDFYLDPGNYQSYLWQDGNNGPVFPVYETGLYSVTVTDLNNCEGSDEVFVRVGVPISMNADTSFCQGSSLLISAGTDYDYYNWNTGDTTSFLWIESEGIYTVIAGMNIEDCEFYDTISITKVPLPFVSIPDTNMCQGDQIIVEVDKDESYTYFWNGIEGSFQYSFYEGCDNIIAIENQCGTAIDTFKITEFPKPKIEISTNTYYLWNENEQAILELNSIFDTYNWQDGSSSPQFYVSYDMALNQHLYSVEVFDGKCSNSDSIVIESIKFGIPPFISPNGDGINDIFKPKYWFGIKNHQITVFNRWGQIVWESNNFQNGWNGKRGLMGDISDGTYFWILEVRFEDGLKRVFKGSLTILNGH